MKPRPTLGLTFAVLGGLIWSGTSPLSAYMLDVYAVPPLVLAFWRDAMIALACVVGLLILQPAALRLPWRDLRGFAAAGTVGVGIYHALFITSIAFNGAALAIVLVYLYPAFVTLGSRLLFREPVSGRQLLALAFAVGGCALAVRAYDPAVLQVSWVGVLIGLVSAATHAIYVLFSQRAMARHSPWVSLALTMSFGALALLVMLLISGSPSAVGAVGQSLWPWALLLFLALGPTLSGYVLFTNALRHIPAQVASLLVLVEIPAATLLAVVLLGEHLEWPQLLGMALVLVAAALPSLKLRERRARKGFVLPETTIT